MCENCIMGGDEEPCTCVCSTYKGKRHCEKCGHDIRIYNMPL